MLCSAGGTAVVLILIDRASRMIGQVLDVFVVENPILMRARGERIHDMGPS